MKKILSLSLAVVLLGLIAAPFVGKAKADVLYTRGTDARLYTYVVPNTSTATLSSTITTNNRILGFVYSDSAAGVSTLFDSSSASTLTTSLIFAEAHVAAGTQSIQMFPLPKALNNGFVTKNSTSTGVLVVYYE